MVETATAIETNEDGSITYYRDDEAGYIPLMSEGKMPYVWPEDIARYKYKEDSGWKISLYQILENSVLNKLYLFFNVFRAKITGKKLDVPGGFSSTPFWSKRLQEKRFANEYNSPQKHESLVKFLKNSNNLGQYIWIDGQPLYRLEEGRYMVTDHSISSRDEERLSQEPNVQEKIFDVEEEDFEDYLDKNWSVKDKGSERRITN